jgi:hypothetical protein
MTAKLLMVLSASIIFILGVTHLVYTFWGTGLTPRSPALRLSMTSTSPVLTNETTMWRCWIGFNATHSMVLVLFGVIYGYFALTHDQLLFRSPFLLLVGFVTLACLVVICKLYFFKTPLIGGVVSLVSYVLSIAASRS